MLVIASLTLSLTINIFYFIKRLGYCVAYYKVLMAHALLARVLAWPFVLHDR